MSLERICEGLAAMIAAMAAHEGADAVSAASGREF